MRKKNDELIAHQGEKRLTGEIEAAKGKFDEAVAHLRQGIAYEDDLAYSEPAPWHTPVRQTLGAVLLKAGQPAEAEAVFREDLENLRHNGWSLIGLYKSLQEQGKDQDAREVRQEFDRVWDDADIEIVASVL